MRFSLLSLLLASFAALAVQSAATEGGAPAAGAGGKAAKEEGAAPAAPAKKSKKAKAPAVTAKYGEAQLMVTSGARSSGGVAPVSRAKAAYPKAAAAAVAASEGQYLHITFDVTNAESGEGLTPHQAFVRLTNVETKAVAVFVAAPDATTFPDRAGTHKATLDLSDRKALAGAAEAGTYSVEVIVGDAAVANPVVWAVGTVSLTPPAAKPTAPPPLYTTPLLHESDRALGPLKEIIHQFRAPEARPAGVISLAFAGLIAASFVGWLGVVSKLGLRAAVPSGPTFVWAVGFHGSFAAMLVLFTAYWLKLTMFTTLGYACVISVPLVLFGRNLLRALTAADAEASAAVKSHAE